MNIKHLIFVFFLLAGIALPPQAHAAGEEKARTLRDLNSLLENSFSSIHDEGQLLLQQIDMSCQDMRDAIDENENLRIRLFNQDPYFTLNLSWLLKATTKAGKEFISAHGDFERNFDFFDNEIDRYDRLLQSLRQRVVDPELEPCRDSCIYLVSDILDYYHSIRDTMTVAMGVFKEADSIFKDTRKYVEMRYDRLQDYVFREGQEPWLLIIKNEEYYANVLMSEMNSQYIMGGSITDDETFSAPGYKAENTLLFALGVFMTFLLLVFLAAGALLTCLCARIFKLGKRHNGIQKFLFGLLLGCAGFLFYLYFWAKGYDIFVMAMYRMFRSFVWMLAILLANLLVRIKPHQLSASFRIYLPTVFMALVVIIFRICFMPDLLITVLLAPILAMFCILQLIACLHLSRKVERIDAAFGWVSLTLSVAALVVALLGYTFVAMLILIFWYFQLTVVLTVQCMTYMIRQYQEKRMNPQINKYHARVAAITGLEKDSLLFGFTWFYELMMGVVLPVIIILSLPFCLQLTLDVFDFDELFHAVFSKPFIHLTDKGDAVCFTLSFQNLVRLLCLFFIFRYGNKMIHSLWQSYRYKLFKRKYHRTTIRSNEINLSLDNSIISVIVWFIYIVIVIVALKIPIGSMSLVAGGLSAGIGLSLKDTINNFICGIQLMGGRLRVGDFLECDGLRGKVKNIGYQSTQIQTTDDNLIVFSNSTLFSKNFKNLTRGSAYESLKIPVTVSYGTDVDKVRTLLMNASKVLLTKDRFGRDVVDPKRGIKVVLVDFGDSGIDLALKQHVLVEKRSDFATRAVELVYKTLTENGINIPYQQFDVHLVQDSE